jgi:hypothetical protein
VCDALAVDDDGVNDEWLQGVLSQPARFESVDDCRLSE